MTYRKSGADVFDWEKVMSRLEHVSQVTRKLINRNKIETTFTMDDNTGNSIKINTGIIFVQTGISVFQFNFSILMKTNSTLCLSFGKIF